MIRFLHRRDGSGEGAPAPSEAPEDRTAVILERFDFDHPVFREIRITPEADQSHEPLPDPMASRVETLKTLVYQQAGTIEILAALDAPMLDRERDADRYVDDRLQAGESRKDIRADIEAVHEALEARISGIALTTEEDK